MMDQIEKEEAYSDSDTAVTPKKNPMKNADVETPIVQVDFEAELNNVNNIILTNNSHVLPNKVSSKKKHFFSFRWSVSAFDEIVPKTLIAALLY